MINVFSKQACQWVLPVALAAIVSTDLRAESIAWWRFDGSESGSILKNVAESGSAFDVESCDTAEVIAEASAPFIRDGEGKFYPNKYSYRNGEYSEGSLVNDPVGVDRLREVLRKASFTVEAIILHDATKQYASVFVGNNMAQPRTSPNLGIGTDVKSVFGFGAFNTKDANFTPTVATYLKPGHWYHVAAVGVWDGQNTTVQMYVDGVESGEPVIYEGGLLVDSLDQFSIGGPDSWNGLIDELRVSDRALRPEEFLKMSETDN